MTIWTHRSAAWERALASRVRLELDPTSRIAIKRDVREFTVSVSAGAMARSFATVMADPQRSFAGIQILRPTARVGQPFAHEDRFQGRFPLAPILRRALGRRPFLTVPPRQRDTTDASGLEAVWRHCEDRFTSDYGEIVELELGEHESTLRYDYLDGSAMAGHSRFHIVSVGPDRACVTQVWEYQETSSRLLTAFSTFVLPLHLAVVYSQIEQSVEAAGGVILASHVPAAYRLATTGLRHDSPRSIEAAGT